jgi:hypothetical protein
VNHDTQSLRRASLTAGLALALIIVLATFGAFGAVGALITPGDAAKTAQDILGSEGLFRWGIASLILVVILDIVVAVAMLTLFMPVSPSPLNHGRLVSTRLSGDQPGGDQPALGGARPPGRS